MAGEGDAISELIAALRCLPGVGPKSAQRMALHLLTRDRPGGRRLAAALNAATERVGHCRDCRTLSEAELCRQCASPGRDQRLLCVVETPGELLALEQATEFRGRYFVLHGRLSPLDGIGPAEIGLDLLETRLDLGVIEELILATSPSIEGEATAQYLAGLARSRGVKATRIAHGVPLGGELEYVDGGTLLHAFSGRQAI